jgi:hypothetical protein
MPVVGHNLKRVWYYGRESLWNGRPGPLDKLSALVDQHGSFHHPPEQAFLTLNAARSKVGATAAIIVPASNRSSVVNSGIVRHFLRDSVRLMLGRGKPRPYKRPSSWNLFSIYLFIGGLYFNQQLKSSSSKINTDFDRILARREAGR